jgi:hypothetical protein
MWQKRRIIDYPCPVPERKNITVTGSTESRYFVKPAATREHSVILFSLYCDWSRGSSGSIVSGYGLDDHSIEVRSPAEVSGQRHAPSALYPRG